MFLEIIYFRKFFVYYVEVVWELGDINLKEKVIVVFFNNKILWL